MVKDAFKMLLDSPLLVSRHFKLSEFLHSDTAEKLKIDNHPHTYKRFSVILHNLENLCTYLETLRAAYGNKPIYITSGVRSVQLNNKVGGNYGSFHLYGAAADITAHDFEELCESLDWCFYGHPKLYYYADRDKKYIHLQLKTCLKDEREKC